MEPRWRNSLGVTEQEWLWRRRCSGVTVEELYRSYSGGGVQERQYRRCLGATEEVLRSRRCLRGVQKEEVFSSHSGGGVQK